MSAKTIQKARTALWSAMVEVAEETNDLVVDSQRNAASSDATRFSKLASRLAMLARGATLLAECVETRE